ncbi:MULTISPECIES: hypothetical protein [unclassified Bradyrhizobium]|uniref:hypothetical protein n=1 Tax=unclassified Bradyrhizobium TaxID=2631580 RepID=UPI0024799A73|nr:MULTISPECIES: hypothetical protein [unclassified Bradyrhizobium]WGR70486.1 hypothetical protein MTX24_34885 [Bradyrhizobium sp. ISRA426]WGR82542.1 hypothetical protein MTX21_19985 [Bradyrhizobium sp. ISRA430]WGR85729.1 hypothetical protein MTX25_34570 [Bradyrhizobium sp. ISRA432]
MEVQVRGAPRELRRAKVAELVGDQVPNSPEATPERLRELQQHARALKDAVKVLEDRLGHERTAASVIVCNQVREEHSRRARETCLKLLELHAAMLAYAELVDALNAEDIAWSYLGPAQLLALGNPRDNSLDWRFTSGKWSRPDMDVTELPQALR